MGTQRHSKQPTASSSLIEEHNYQVRTEPTRASATHLTSSNLEDFVGSTSGASLVSKHDTDEDEDDSLPELEGNSLFILVPTNPVRCLAAKIVYNRLKDYMLSSQLYINKGLRYFDPFIVLLIIINWILLALSGSVPDDNVNDFFDTYTSIILPIGLRIIFSFYT
jgi:hypothetical protein